MKVTITFLSSEILANFSLDVELLPVAICICISLKVFVDFRKKRRR